jgi:Tfp pilus assembly protein PilO
MYTTHAVGRIFKKQELHAMKKFISIFVISAALVFSGLYLNAAEKKNPKPRKKTEEKRVKKTTKKKAAKTKKKKAMKPSKKKSAKRVKKPEKR